MTPTGARTSDAARFDMAYRSEARRARRDFIERSVEHDAIRVVGPEIVHSWRRSRRQGVDPSGTSLPTIDLDETRAQGLAQAADPVMQELARQCRDSETWGFLLDRECVQIYPIVGDDRLVEEGERRGSGLGAVYRESTVGTNGASVAIERLEPFMVIGPEHYRESEHNLVSVGVPLRDAMGRLAGMFLMCSRLRQANHLVRPYAHQIADAISREIAARTDRDERILFEEFSRSSTRPSLPVVAMSDRVFVTNVAAQQQLRDPAHVDLLRDALLDVAARGTSHMIELQLGDRQVRVHCRVVEISQQRSGVVASFGPVDAGAQTPVEASPHTERLQLLADARSRGLPVLLVGERGAGRTWLARSFTDLTEVDAGTAPVDPATWLDQLREAITSESPVLVRDVDTLDPQTRAAALGLLRASGRWCLATSQSPVVDGAGGADGVFPAVVACPPLRSRRSEIDELVTRLLPKLGGAGCTPEAMSVLVGHEWPGNLAQLRRVLATAVLASPSRTVGIEHLPRDIVSSGSMGQMERAERELIFEALRQADWNRDAAARSLGISRATLYRRIKQFSFQIPSSRR